MSDQSRSLPDRPNLRFLKLEARRRLAAGEFDTLHNAQLAIAREHGLSSWTVLKEAVQAEQPDADGHALAQVRWLVSRFSGADGRDWQPPGDAELREHFEERFLTAIPPWRLVAQLANQAAPLREELIVLDQEPLVVRARAGGLQIEAHAGPAGAHRLTGLRAYPVGSHVADPRVAEPSAGHTDGDVPDQVSQIADGVLAELGLAGLVLAGAAAGGGAAWAASRGWADLDRPETLRPEHRFPAPGVTKLVTAVATLRLAADGRVDLDGPANGHLRTVRLADDAVTVRELLTHTAGVDIPAELFADTVPGLASLTGPVLACTDRGTFRFSNVGYAVLGQLIADVTGSSYAEAAAALVLGPLAMTASSFPTTWPHDDSAAVTGYVLTQGGVFSPVRRQVATMPATAGLWATAADLVRFATEWSSLLPDSLAREALTPQADRSPGVGQVGLGWMLNRDKGVAGHPGISPGVSVSMIIHVDSGQACVALTNRHVPIEPVNARVIRALTGTGQDAS
jgi:CubicO group peptidase (beta-lactamase class C family)